MGKYAFRYSLCVAFQACVTQHHFTLRCFPGNDDRQQILETRWQIAPDAVTWHGEDSFGGILLQGAISQPHDAFSFSLSGIAETSFSNAVKASGKPLEGVFRYPTELTQMDDALREFASGLPQCGDALDTGLAVMEAVGKTMTYLPGSTNVHTDAAAAFAQKKGVCQDYVHICLALLRSMGIPARYVVGFIPGEGESHAWLELQRGDSWFGLDPTNQLLAADGYIKLSHGRDYRDCTINRGVFFGSWETSQEVRVTVTPLD